MERNVMDIQPIQQEFDFSIVSPKLTIEAMRDSGYKDTDHALAELIDNSLEADADLVEIIAVETPPDPDQRYARARVSEIAVADNGEGMDSTTLRRALKFWGRDAHGSPEAGHRSLWRGTSSILNLAVSASGYLDVAKRRRQRLPLLS